MLNGYQNEFDFINYLNKSKFRNLNIVMQEFLRALFPDIDDDDFIAAYKYGRYAKVDMVIVVKGVRKGISIKSGDKNSVHVEKIEQFILFLKKSNFQEIDLLLRYLYSDGTNNNTGLIRQSSSEYKLSHEEDIRIINDELKKIVQALIKRFLISADVNYKVTVDAFIVGNVHDFLWATTNEVLVHLEHESLHSSGVHASNLFIQNWNKNLKYNSKYEYCREYIQVKWYSLFDDLIKIMSVRDKN